MKNTAADTVASQPSSPVSSDGASTSHICLEEAEPDIKSRCSKAINQ